MSTFNIPKLHPDWPDANGARHTWDLRQPLSDFVTALEQSRKDRLSVNDVASIDRYYVSYHGMQWTPTSGAEGSELTLVAIGRLKDGRWFAVEAWNDYTGWGCQDGSDVVVGDSEADVISRGLTLEGRGLLGVESGGAA